jgi:hypothetical protein
MDEADVHPLREQRRLPFGDGAQPLRVSVLRAAQRSGSWRAMA